MTFTCARLLLVTVFLSMGVPSAAAEGLPDEIFVPQAAMTQSVTEDDSRNVIDMRGGFGLPDAMLTQTGGDNRMTVRQGIDAPCTGCSIIGIQDGNDNRMVLTQRSGAGSVIDVRSIGDGNVLRVTQR